jgi:hypothetical protein
MKRKDNPNPLLLWWFRHFKVISNQRAKELGLVHWRNAYGDEIFKHNCKSFWLDNNQYIYRAKSIE